MFFCIKYKCFSYKYYIYFEIKFDEVRVHFKTFLFVGSAKQMC